MLNNFLKKLILKVKILHNIFIKHKYFFKRKTYSMEGEDLIIFKNIDVAKNKFFVDVGCYHPLHINNTFLLYKNGWRGINIDVSENSIELFKFIRPKDINIVSAISEKNGEVTLYSQKKISQLTTIKKEVSIKRMQGKINEKIVKSNTLNSILSNTKYKNQTIDFLNIDIEGADFEALKSLDFDIYRPKLICIEIDTKDILGSSIYKYLINLNYEKIWSSNSKLTHIFKDVTHQL